MIIAKYYVKTKKGFAIRKTMNGKRKEYAVCEDEQTAKKLVKELKKVGWDEEQLDRAVYNMLNKREPKYYTFHNGHYEVIKMINGRKLTYGRYKDEEMAKAIVEELKLARWNKDRLPEIQEKLGWETPNKNYFFSTHQNKWKINRMINDKNHYFGLYDFEEDAKKMVKALRKRNWKVDDLKSLADELDIKVYLFEPKNYSFNKERGKYNVTFYRDNKAHFVKWADTEEEAIELVNKWRENEKEVLHKN